MRACNQRGIALMIVLMLSAVLSLLAVAFVAVNRQQVALTGDSLRRSQALDAALTGLAYAKAQLEANGQWGAKAFANGQNGPAAYGPMVNVTIHGDGQDTGGPDGRPDIRRNYVEGTIRAAGGVEGSFTVRVVNNLLQTSLLNNTDPTLLQLGVVPAQTIRVRVDGRCGTATRRLEVALRKKAFTDYSVSTDQDLSVNPGATPKRGLSVATRDVLNSVRANGNISVPRPTQNLLRFIGPRGSLKAGQDITVGTVNVSDPGQQATRAAEQQAANGLFQPQSGRVNIPRLEADQLALPERSINNVSAGKYEFLTATYNYLDPSGAVTLSKHCRAIKLPNGQIKTSQLAEVWEFGGGEPPESTGGVGWQPIEGVTPSEAEFGMVVLGTTEDDPSDIKEVAVDLKTGSLSFPPGVTVNVDGSLDFLGATQQKPTGYRSTNVPANFTALFGADASILGNSVRFEIPANSFAEFTEKGGALNVTGSLHIGGEVNGLGGITANSNVSFSAAPALSSTKNLGVAVRAGNEMKLAPPPKLSRAKLLAADGPAFIGAHDRLTQAQREQLDLQSEESLVASISQASTGLKAEDAATEICNELDGLGFNYAQFSFNDPPLSSLKNQTLDLQQYVRLREFITAPQVSRDIWLGNDQAIRDLIKARITGQLDIYRSFANTSGISLTEFFATGAEVPDMMLRGLVYAGNGGIKVEGAGNSFLSEGALVAHGDITMADLPSYISIYNRDYLDDIGSRTGSTQYRLEVVYLGSP